jgi:hypothetical protein
MISSLSSSLTRVILIFGLVTIIYIILCTENNLNNPSSLDSLISYITGYKTFGHLGIGIVSFVQFLDGLVQLTGGRFQYRFPPDNAAHWLVIITVATNH